MTALFDRKSLLEGISFHLSTMESCLKWHTGRGHNDNAKILEDVMARFLAVLCGWDLKNLNFIRANYPVGDLGDFGKRIAIQVTVDGTTTKVGDTHTKAIKHHFSQDFDRLIICFLLEKAPNDPKNSKSFTPCTSPKIEKWARPQINALLDARDDEDAAAHLDRLRRAAHALSDEMSALRAILSPALAYRPCNLPFASIGDHFKGRVAFLEELHTALTTGSAAAIKGHAIRGDGGIGKTCAAVEYAWRYSKDYTALLFVRADDPQRLETGLAALGFPEILNLPGHLERKHPDQFAAVLSHLQTNPGWLLILDNADTPEAMQAVKERLPVLTGGRIIVTTRRNVRIRQLTALNLDFLTEADSVAFLEDGTRGHRRPAADDAKSLNELAGLLDGLPLALTQVAAHISYQKLTYREYLDLWHQNTAASLVWYNEEVMDYPKSLAVTYETSVAQLSKSAALLLQILAWFSPEPIPRTLIGMEGISPEAGSHLAELERLNLVRPRHHNATFSMHRVLQEITRQQHIESKTGDYLQEALRWINPAIPNDIDDFRNWSTISLVVPHAIFIATQAEKYGLNQQTDRLLHQLGLYHLENAHYHTAELLIDKASKLTIKAHGLMHPDSVIRCKCLASLYAITGRAEMAVGLFTECLEIEEQLFGQADSRLVNCLSGLTHALIAQGDFERAEVPARRAVTLCNSGDVRRSGEAAFALLNCAHVLKVKKNYSEAEPLMRRALLLLQTEYGERHPKVATCLSNIALLCRETNRLQEAVSYLRQACAISAETVGTNHPSHAVVLNNLSNLLDELGEADEAVALMRQALSSAVELQLQNGHPSPSLERRIRNYRILLRRSGATPEQAEEEIQRILAPILKP